jgi:hypothetical protein
MEQSLFENLTGFAASQQIPRIYGTPKFITVFTSARHLSLSWDRSIQSPQPLPTSSRYLLILSSHLRLGLPNGLFLPGFPTKTLCTTLKGFPLLSVNFCLLTRRCVLLGWGLCDGPIPHPGKSYWLCICVCHCVWSGTTITLCINNQKVGGDKTMEERKKERTKEILLY